MYDLVFRTHGKQFSNRLKSEGGGL